MTAPLTAQLDLAFAAHFDVDGRGRTGGVVRLPDGKPGKAIAGGQRTRMSGGIHEADRRALVDDVGGDHREVIEIPELVGAGLVRSESGHRVVSCLRKGSALQARRNIFTLPLSSALLKAR